MIGEALYYPQMRIDNPAWLRSQLLYFDRISTISPWHVKGVPEGPDENELIDFGCLIRRPPTFMKAAVERASRFMAMLLVMSRDGGIASHFGTSSLYSEVSPNALGLLRGLGDANRGQSVRRLAPHIDELRQELESHSDRPANIHPFDLVGESGSPGHFMWLAGVATSA